MYIFLSAYLNPFFSKKTIFCGTGLLMGIICWPISASPGIWKIPLELLERSYKIVNIINIPIVPHNNRGIIDLSTQNFHVTSCLWYNCNLTNLPLNQDEDIPTLLVPINGILKQNDDDIVVKVYKLLCACSFRTYSCTWVDLFHLE